MAIDPDNINTTRVGQLADAPFSLTDQIPHEVGTDLKRGSVQSFADFLALQIGASSGISFVAVTVPDGGTLPNTTQEEWLLVGKGTFYNVNGGATIVTTEELNALISNGTFWSIGVEIPIAAELIGITEFIRSGFTTTAPSENAVFNALAEKANLDDIPSNSDKITNNSEVEGATVTEALDNLKDDIDSFVQTTAGVYNRINFTADPVTITAGTFYHTDATSKGTVASVIQSVVNDDNQKKYFTQDLIGNAFPALQTFPAGIYAGHLSVRVSPNSAQQRYTVEIYKTNNGGTPIASGITGAPVGSLGVTVVAILDSGIINLADNAITSVPVSGQLASQLSIATGERIRYHVSAEKVGTAGANITMEVFYGSSYNSYYDVPVTFNLQTNYNNSVSPQITTTVELGAVTIKRGSAADTDNILVGQNGSGVNTFEVKGNGDQVINGFINGTVTRALPAGNTFIGQTFNTTQVNVNSRLINRITHNYNEDGVASTAINTGIFQVFGNLNKTTNQPSSNYTGFQSELNQLGGGSAGTLNIITSVFNSSGTGSINGLSYFFVQSPSSSNAPISNLYGVHLVGLPQVGVINSKGIFIGELTGSNSARAFDSSVSAGTGKFNIYAQGTANNYFKGKILVDAVDNGVDIIRANGSVLATGYKVTGTTGFLKSDGTVDTSTHVTGSGTTNAIPLFTGGSVLGNSLISQSGFSVGINGTTVNDNVGDPAHVFNINNNVTGASQYLFQATTYANSTGEANVHIRKARGTATTPLPVQSGDLISSWGFRGYASTKFASSSAAMITNAEENFTDTANGTSLTFSTTPLGTFNSRVDALKLNPSGDFTFYKGGEILAPSTSLHSLTLKGGSSIGGADAQSGELIIGSSATYRGKVSYNGLTGVMYLDNSYNDNNGDIVFRTKSAGSVLAPLTIKGSSVISIANLAGTGTRQVVADASGNLSATVIQPLVYTATLTQIGTSAPVVTVLNNTLGGAIVWTRSSVGIYTGSLTGGFPSSSKTVILIGQNDFVSIFTARWAGANSIEVTSDMSGVLTDARLNNTSLKIEVYP